jgi:hypothetical protein
MYNQLSGSYWDGQKWVSSAPIVRRPSTRGIRVLLATIFVGAGALAVGATLVLMNSGEAGGMLDAAGLNSPTPTATHPVAPPSNRSQP